MLMPWYLVVYHQEEKEGVELIGGQVGGSVRNPSSDGGQFVRFERRDLRLETECWSLTLLLIEEEGDDASNN